MPRRITLEPHLDADELYRRYRTAREASERSHYQMLWLLSTGKTTREVGEITGYSVAWIYELVRGYNRYGAESLGDKRKQNPGASPLLDDQQQALLWQALQEPPADGGLWTGPKVAAWMGELLGRKVYPQRGWEYLKTLGYVRRRPRPASVESDENEQREWKKNFRRRSSGSNESIQPRR